MAPKRNQMLPPGIRKLSKKTSFENTPQKKPNRAKPRTSGDPKDQYNYPFPPNTPPQGATPKKTEPLRSAFRHHLRGGLGATGPHFAVPGGPGGRGTPKIDSKLTNKTKKSGTFFTLGWPKPSYFFKEGRGITSHISFNMHIYIFPIFPMEQCSLALEHTL
jgi:hypothetical protein